MRYGLGPSFAIHFDKMLPEDCIKFALWPLAVRAQ
jgi:hypothetical protein